MRRRPCSACHPRKSGDPVTEARQEEARPAGRTILQPRGYWVPAFAGMTGRETSRSEEADDLLDRRDQLRLRSEEARPAGRTILQPRGYWVPAFEGMTGRETSRSEEADDLLDRRDQLRLGHLELAGTLGPPGGVVGDRAGQALGLGKVLDLDDALRLLVAALDDDERRVAPVGIFHLGAHSGFAQIHLGGDAGMAELGHHRLIFADTVAVHDEDDHRAGGILGIVRVEGGERGLQARYADREASRRDRLVHEAPDEAVIAPAPADRAEHHRLTLL